MWLTFLILMKKLVGLSFDKQHSTFGNTARPITNTRDLKYSYISVRTPQ